MVILLYFYSKKLAAVEIQEYKSEILEYLSKYIKENLELQAPTNLYKPIEYILSLGGKRIRPVLTLMSCDIFGGKYHDAIPAAMCIEFFHNFTLIHDDIMDKAEKRRGQPTVHCVWNQDIAILSGDALMFLAAQHLETYDAILYKKLSQLFNKTAVEVCEGQQYDMDFETLEDIALSQYIKMIAFKTAVLLACALKMGGVIAGADEKDLECIYRFGYLLGIAFQLQDDYLDAYATADFGKRLGGDIVENKKTFLYLKALELADKADKDTLLQYYNGAYNANDKVKKVKAIFDKYKIPEILAEEVEAYTNDALEQIDQLSVTADKKDILINFANSLMNRQT